MATLGHRGQVVIVRSTYLLSTALNRPTNEVIQEAARERGQGADCVIYRINKPHNNTTDLTLIKKAR